MLRLVVGLGNPGLSYATTRHNAGFWLLDRIARLYQRSFSYNKKFNAEEARIDNDIRLLKPHTFMNLSGQAVSGIARFYRIETTQILVAHDEVDLPVGAIKIKNGGGDAGHNGLASITQCLGSCHYWRLRIGVGRKSFGDVSKYVLSSPPTNEQLMIDEGLERVIEVWDKLINNDYNSAMTNLHRKNSKRL